jgi:ribose 5-phosphate isomerase
MAISKPFIAARRFTSTIGAGTGTGATFAIAATAFTTDTGAAATAFPASPAFYNLYINAMLQTSDTSTATTTSITISGGDALDPANPVIVEFVVN